MMKKICYSVGGPFTILLPYLAEFHAPEYQPQFTRWAGFIFGISLMIPAGMINLINH